MEREKLDYGKSIRIYNYNVHFDSGKVFCCKAFCLAKMIAAVLRLFTKHV